MNLDATKAKKELKWNSFWSQPESIDRSFEWWAKVLTQRISPLEACNEEISLLIQNSKFRDVAKNA